VSEKDLRDALIKLAHRKPELRKDLLPLLSQRVAKSDTKSAAGRLPERQLQDRIRRSVRGYMQGLRDLAQEIGEEFYEERVVLGDQRDDLIKWARKNHDIWGPDTQDIAKGFLYGWHMAKRRESNR
jgi:hypothetical protein